MSKFCTFCGTSCAEQDAFCHQCGASFDDHKETPSVAEGARSEAPESDDTVCSVMTDKNGHNKKSRKRFGFLKFLIILICVAAVGLLLWMTFGKWLTLRLHSDLVVETLNAGSLDFPGSHKSDYDELPDYAKEMLGESLKKEQENGPLMNAVLPYLQVNRTKIHWLRSGASIDYVISAPDVEAWLLKLGKEDIAKGQDAVVAKLEQYLKTAERRENTVTIEYTKSGFFSADWSGNYETVEFADAISGGVNAAYNTLYQEAMTEWEENLK